jgi:hypothetical protein
MKKLRFGIDDVLIVGGAGLFTAGIYQIYPPAAYIALGAALVFLGITVGRQG